VDAETEEEEEAEEGIANDTYRWILYGEVSTVPENIEAAFKVAVVLKYEDQVKSDANANADLWRYNEVWCL
jgi:hypothetical protein